MRSTRALRRRLTAAFRGRRLAGMSVAAALVVCAAVTAGGVAQAAPGSYAPSIGSVSALTPTGKTTDGFSVKTSQNCPATARAFIIYIDQAAAGWNSILASTSEDVASLTSGVPLSDTLTGIAANALPSAVSLVNGTYDVSLVCYEDLLGGAALAQFDATFSVAGTMYVWNVPGETATTTTLTVQPAVTSTVGVSVTLTAAVTPAAASGTVQFTDTVGGVTSNIGAPVAVAGGAASVSTPALVEGAHTLGAVFTPGSTSFAASTAPTVTHTVTAVGQTATTTALTVSPSGTAAVGAAVTLTASVTPATSTGTVTFTDLSTGTALGSAPVTSGTATVTTSDLVAGSRRLVAVFAPSSTASSASTSPEVPYIITDTTQPQPGVGPPLGLLTVTTPDSRGAGTAASAIKLATGRPCLTPADTTTVQIFGPGGWASGVPMASDSVASTSDAFSVGTSSIADAGATFGLVPEPGVYLIQLTCTTTLEGGGYGYFIGQLWFYDQTNWLNQDPAIVGIPTQTLLAVAPVARGVVGSTVTLTATVTPALTGTVKFVNNDQSNPSDLASVPLKNGVATASLKTLPFGLYYVAATFVPATTGTKYLGSSSPEIVHAITRSLPPYPPKAAVVSGKAKVGAKLTCTGGFTNAVTTTYGWLRNGYAVSGASKSSYTLVAADKGALVSCRIAGTNSGGTTSRISAPVKVTS